METKDTQIEGLEEIAKKHLGIDLHGPHLLRLFADPAILAHIPAVKALQEEVERLKATTCAMHELRVMTEAYAEQVRRIATLESKLADERLFIKGLQAQLAGGEAVADALDHAANEWADAFYNAQQHIRNIREGFSKPDEKMMANLAWSSDHGQAVWSAARALRNNPTTHPVSANQPDSGKHVCPEHCMRIPEFCPECSAAPVESVEEWKL